MSVVFWYITLYKITVNVDPIGTRRNLKKLMAEGTNPSSARTTESMPTLKGQLTLSRQGRSLMSLVASSYRRRRSFARELQDGLMKQQPAKLVKRKSVSISRSALHLSDARVTYLTLRPGDSARPLGITFRDFLL